MDATAWTATYKTALAAARGGDYKIALGVFDRLSAKPPSGISEKNLSMVHYNRAACYSMIGEAAPSLDALVQAFESGYSKFDHARTDPHLANCRKDGRFNQVWVKYQRAAADASPSLAVPDAPASPRLDGKDKSASKRRFSGIRNTIRRTTSSSSSLRADMPVPGAAGSESPMTSSGPTEVKHVSHAGFDGGKFVATNLPPELRAIFEGLESELERLGVEGLTGEEGRLVLRTLLSNPQFMSSFELKAGSAGAKQQCEDCAKRPGTTKIKDPSSDKVWLLCRTCSVRRQHSAQLGIHEQTQDALSSTIRQAKSEQDELATQMREWAGRIKQLEAELASVKQALEKERELRREAEASAATAAPGNEDVSQELARERELRRQAEADLSTRDSEVAGLQARVAELERTAAEAAAVPSLPPQVPVSIPAPPPPAPTPAAAPAPAAPAPPPPPPTITAPPPAPAAPTAAPAASSSGGSKIGRDDASFASLLAGIRSGESSLRKVEAGSATKERANEEDPSSMLSVLANALLARRAAISTTDAPPQDDEVDEGEWE
jgi:hypothetical protein